MNENDMRVKKTRKQLRQALIDLVLAHGYEHITVREIAEKANVGFKTFYRHYESKEALFQALVDELLIDFKQVLLPPSDEQASQQNTLAVLAYVEVHAKLFLMILNSSAANQLMNAAMAAALQEGRQIFRGAHIPDDLLAHHFAASMIGFLRWWLESGMIYSREEMSDYIHQILIWPMAQLSRP